MHARDSNGTCGVLDKELRDRFSDALLKQKAAAQHVLRVIEEDKSSPRGVVDRGTRVPYDKT